MVSWVDTRRDHFFSVSTSSFSTFFGLLTLAAWAATITVWVLALAHRRSPDTSLGLLFEDVGRAALWLAALVAIVTTLGSLYFSEVAHFIPCKLCWYQRIAMYPLSITLLIAALRRAQPRLASSLARPTSATREQPDEQQP